MNSVTVIGRVGRQPELRYTNTGTAVCEITIAVDGPDDNVEWIPVVTWGRTAEAVAQHVRKGRQVGVEGELRVSEWEPDTGPKRYDVKVHARRVDFLAKPLNTDEPEPATPHQLSPTARPSAPARGEQGGCL